MNNEDDLGEQEELEALEQLPDARGLQTLQTSFNLDRTAFRVLTNPLCIALRNPLNPKEIMISPKLLVSTARAIAGAMQWIAPTVNAPNMQARKPCFLFKLGGSHQIEIALGDKGCRWSMFLYRGLDDDEQSWEMGVTENQLLFLAAMLRMAADVTDGEPILSEHDVRSPRL